MRDFKREKLINRFKRKFGLEYSRDYRLNRFNKIVLPPLCGSVADFGGFTNLTLFAHDNVDSKVTGQISVFKKGWVKENEQK